MQNLKWWKIRITGIIIVTIFLLSCSVPSGDSFRFVFMTDIHVQHGRRGIEGYEAAIDHVNSLNPDFVITGGDLIMDALEQSFQRADSLYRIFEQTSDLFEMDVYHCIGNHEHFGVYKNSGVSPDHPEYNNLPVSNFIVRQYFQSRICTG